MRRLPQKIGKPKKIFPEQYGKSLEEQQFKNPKNGKKYKYIFFTGKTSSLIFPLTEKYEVIAIDQYRYAADGIFRELPGGNPKYPGQSPEETLREELLEETGYRAEKIILVKKGLWFEPSSVKATYNVYLGLGCKKVAEPKPDSNEYIFRINLIPLKEWVVKTLPTLKDNKTIAASILAILKLGIKLQFPSRK